MRPDANSPPALVERLAALAILFALIAAAGAILTAPLREALAMRQDARERLVRYEALAREPVAQVQMIDPAILAAEHIDAAAAQLALQSLLDIRARTSALNVQSIAPAGGEALGEVGQITWVEAALYGDLQAVTDFVAQLDAERPMLLIRSFEIGADSAFQSDRSLNLRVEIGRVWRTVGSAGAEAAPMARAENTQ